MVDRSARAWTTWILHHIRVLVDMLLLEGSVAPLGCGVDWEVMLSRAAGLGQQSLELAWLLRDAWPVSPWDSASIWAL